VSGSTLLYIEDNESNLHLVRRIFRDRDDITLITASRGMEGVEMAKVQQPVLILLDLHLPDMPGLDVLATLRAEPSTAAIPVVAVSADATTAQIEHVREAGVADYVTKPFEVPRLVSVVDAIVTSAATADASEAV
jgi:CheY-like chemotaxis protein